jgi:hypothetical protein
MEFGGSVTALIWGARAEEWDKRYPWAIGRCEGWLAQGDFRTFLADFV